MWSGLSCLQFDHAVTSSVLHEGHIQHRCRPHSLVFFFESPGLQRGSVDALCLSSLPLFSSRILAPLVSFLTPASRCAVADHQLSRINSRTEPAANQTEFWEKLDAVLCRVAGLYFIPAIDTDGVGRDHVRLWLSGDRFWVVPSLIGGRVTSHDPSDEE